MLLVLPCSVWASTDIFLINFSITDTGAPTIPTGVAAVPISTDQIDVTWTASTDDVGVAGYQVFRDGTVIATTTLTSYSDAGLTSSTTYDYVIRAFDAGFVFSTSSATATASTLSPVVAPENRSGSIVPFGIVVDDWVVFSDTESITITFTTNSYVRSQVRWGRTVNYELGYSEVGVSRKLHEIVITDLQPGTLYELDLALENVQGIERYYDSFTVRTKSGPDIDPPPNVINLDARIDANNVVLTWQNPSIADLDRIRIVRSATFFPRDLADGVIVFDGVDERAVDVGVATEDGLLYYTVFSVDTSGNVSSGAVAYVSVANKIVTPEEPSLPTDPTQPVQSGTGIIPVLFMQEAVTAELLPDIPVTIASDQTFTISIPYEVLPEHLKTIVVTMIHPDDARKQFSFLLRVNANKTAYEAVVGALHAPGIYETTVLIYDFVLETVTDIEGSIAVAGETAPVKDRSYAVHFWLLGLLLLMTTWYFGVYRNNT